MKKRTLIIPSIILAVVLVLSACELYFTTEAFTTNGLMFYRKASVNMMKHDINVYKFNYKLYPDSFYNLQKLNECYSEYSYLKLGDKAEEVLGEEYLLDGIKYLELYCDAYCVKNDVNINQKEQMYSLALAYAKEKIVIFK